MDLSRQDYPGMLAHLQPSQAVKVLNERVKYINRLNADVADWIQERRRIEEAYAQGLRKLAGRQFTDNDVADLGIFSTPWQKILTSTEALSHSHHALAQNLATDVEGPLREFVSGNQEMQAMSNITGNLSSIAKEVDNAQKRADKLKDKGGKAAAGKVANAASDVEAAQGQWDSQAPYVLERLQAVDEARVDQLRNVLTQYQTHIIESVSAVSSSAEDCLNALLNVQTADEIKTFTMKTTKTIPAMSNTARRQSIRQDATVPPPTDAGSSLAPVPSAPRPDDMSSNRSSSFQERAGKSGFGLKRLGTVIGRRRQSTHPYQQGISPERKKSSTNIGSAFGRFGRKESHQNLDTHLSPPPTGRTTSDGPLESPRPSDSGPSPKLERISSERTNGTTLESVGESSGGLGLVNGTQTTSASKLPEPLQPTSPTAPAEPVKDAEGFSVPSQGSDPMQQALNEAAQVNETISPQFKVDIRNAPIEEETGDASAALANVASAFQAQATPRRSSGTVRSRNRNTILVPNNQSIPEIPREPSPASVSLSAPLPASPTPPPAPSAQGTPPIQQLLPSPLVSQSPFSLTHRSTLGLSDHAGSDTHSIRSGRSLMSLASVRHPDFHESGLNSSVVESVSAEISQGSVSRAVVTGEVALAYNPTDLNTPFGTETILLDNFSALEKVAPNPAFIEAVPEKSGQYTVNLSQITKTAVAFKYQVLLPEASTSSRVPLLLIPTWKIDSTGASVKVNYSLNPAFVQSLPKDQTSITLNDVSVIVHLDPSGGRAKSVLTKPEGMLRSHQNLVYWKLGDIALPKEGSPQTLLAKFKTDGEAKPGNVEARWELNLENLPGLGSGLSVKRFEVGVPKEGEEADPFADEGSATATTGAENWKELNEVKRWRNGSSYFAT